MGVGGGRLGEGGHQLQLEMFFCLFCAFVFGLLLFFFFFSFPLLSVFENTFLL